jgi:hypothetical protein
VEVSVMRRDWDVLLLGGAAGTGKTTIGYRVARLFDVGIVEVDDFQVILERMTTPQQQPALHFWRTHPDPGSLSAQCQQLGVPYVEARPWSTLLDRVLATI